MCTDADYPILVAGAGIGGLAVASALNKHGFHVEVYECAKEPVLKENVGVRICSQAMWAVESLGIRDRIQDVGAPVDRIQVWSSDGRFLGESSLRNQTGERGAPSIGIHRSALMHILLEACSHIPIHFDSCCTGFAAYADSVELTLVTGHSPPARLVIGAEGIHSAIRAQLIGDGAPRCAGQTVWRSVSQHCDGLEKNVMVTVSGAHNLRAGCWRIGDSSVAWFIRINAPVGAQDRPGFLKPYLLELLNPIRGPLAYILELASRWDIRRTDIYARGRNAFRRAAAVALLGDAAHAVPNVLGQRTGQTIEDAVILGLSLAHASDVKTGLACYEKHRA